MMIAKKASSDTRPFGENAEIAHMKHVTNEQELLSTITISVYYATFHRVNFEMSKFPSSISF